MDQGQHKAGRAVDSHPHHTSDVQTMIDGSGLCVAARIIEQIRPSDAGKFRNTETAATSPLSSPITNLLTHTPHQ